eukprot:TRINITY_DN4701_c0_g1_i1.p1 TRINITY_DN4701_c0_g1~~TRINITY_DN4701_c0_g1_i1.p1  ORF type:complete len:558 (+),score=239.36 TRINITY_DN4701_c0_g1_i1:120-1793(+)
MPKATHKSSAHKSSSSSKKRKAQPESSEEEAGSGSEEEQQAEEGGSSQESEQEQECAAEEEQSDADRRRGKKRRAESSRGRKGSDGGDSDDADEEAAEAPVPALDSDDDAASDDDNGDAPQRHAAALNAKPVKVTLSLAPAAKRKPPFLVSFPPGAAPPLRSSTLKFALRVNAAEPRHRRRRALAGGDARGAVQYVGTNFGSAGAEALDLCNYLVGVKHPDKDKITLYPAGHCYALRASVKGLETSRELEGPMALAADATSKDRRQALTDSFGSRRQQAAARARAAGVITADAVVGMDALTSAFGTANDDDDDVPKEVADAAAAAVAEARRGFLPPFHEDAALPEDVYVVTEIMGPDVQHALERKLKAEIAEQAGGVGQWLEDALDESQNFNLAAGSPYFKERLAALQRRGKSDSSTRRALLPILYLGHLLSFAAEPPLIRNKDALAFAEKINAPEVVARKFLVDFTSKESDSSGKTVHMRTKQLTERLQVHLLCVALAVEECSLDFAPLAYDLKLDIKKATQLMRQLGCTIKSNSTVATLKVPLKFPSASRGKRAN